ncbi:MAG: HYExAFE family protein [Planctomycetota bacterium]|nr:HYExAFE family protein [Planctomycetota bacterium]
MTQRRHHYEVAFEAFLRRRRVPYVAVNEARKALLPDSTPLKVHRVRDDATTASASLKSFDFVIYGDSSNLLVEVKGRRIASRKPRESSTEHAPDFGGTQLGLGGFALSAQAAAHYKRAAPRLESWVTLDDVEALKIWQSLFGPEFEAAFVFVYWCEDQPADGLFHEVFEHNRRWYSLRAIRVEDYARHMVVRSPKWRTMHVPASVFERICSPFAAPPRSPLDDPTAIIDPGPDLPAFDPR